MDSNNVSMDQLISNLAALRCKLPENIEHKSLYAALHNLEHMHNCRVEQFAKVFKYLRENSIPPHQRARLAECLSEQLKVEDDLDINNIITDNSNWNIIQVFLKRSKINGKFEPWGITISDNESLLSDSCIFIESISDGSAAFRSGELRPHDTIIEANGVLLKGKTHEEASELMKCKEELNLKIRRKFEPITTNPSENSIMNVFLKNDNPGRGFGFSIKGGTDQQWIPKNDGIYISHIAPNTPASNNMQLHKGDRIIMANDVNVEHVVRSEAVRILRLNPHYLHLRIEKSAILFNPWGGAELRESCLREVTLIDNKGRYGIKIIGDVGNIFIYYLMPDSVAHLSNRLFVGDKLLGIGDQSLRNCDVDKVKFLLQNSPASITLKVTYAPKEFQLLKVSQSSGAKLSNKQAFTYYRANFSYNPSLDPNLPKKGLELYDGAIIRVDNNCIGMEDDKPSLWLEAVLVEGFYEEFNGLVPSETELDKGKYPEVKIPKRFQTPGFKLPWRSKSRKCKNRIPSHRFYSRVWRIESERARIIFVIGPLNNTFAELLTQDSPNYVYMMTPPGPLDEKNEIYLNKCMQMAQKDCHVIIPIDMEQLSPYICTFDPLMILINPQSEYAIRQSTSRQIPDSELLTNTLEQCRLQINDLDTNNITIFSTRGSNLGELYYEVKNVISEYSRFVEWVDHDPELNNEFIISGFFITSPKSSNQTSNIKQRKKSNKTRKSVDIL